MNMACFFFSDFFVVIHESSSSRFSNEAKEKGEGIVAVELMVALTTLRSQWDVIRQPNFSSEPAGGADCCYPLQFLPRLFLWHSWWVGGYMCGSFRNRVCAAVELYLLLVRERNLYYLYKDIFLITENTFPLTAIALNCLCAFTRLIASSDYLFRVSFVIETFRRTLLNSTEKFPYVALISIWKAWSGCCCGDCTLYITRRKRSLLALERDGGIWRKNGRANDRWTSSGRCHDLPPSTSKLSVIDFRQWPFRRSPASWMWTLALL